MRTKPQRGSRRYRKNSKRIKKQRRNASRQLSHGFSIARKLRSIIPNDSIFNDFRLHGNTKWRPSELVMLSLVWAMTGSRMVTDGFATASTAFESMFQATPVATYQGLMNALIRWTDGFMEVVFKQLQLSMRAFGTNFYFVFGYVPIAFDGSRVRVPRTVANENAFCAKNYGNGTYARSTRRKGTKIRPNKAGTAHPQEPQIWITMLWHMGLRLPWRWKLGRSDSSERHDVVEMLESQVFPRNSLFCGDAGFVGYHFWQAILQDGYEFIVRVGSNVRLLSESCEYLKQPDGNVLCWPKDVRSKETPIRLRLVNVKVGTADVWLLTSVLSERKLSKQQLVAFYKMRWGIETEFRGLKQTLDGAKMCCLNPARALVELHWSIAAMAASELLATKEQFRLHNLKSYDSRSRWTPRRRSLAQTMRAIRRAIHQPESIPKLGYDLTSMLQDALTDGYKRRVSRKARYRPRPNKTLLKPPLVAKLTENERRSIEKIQMQMNS